jgi:RNA recognition motif-containing protein
LCPLALGDVASSGSNVVYAVNSGENSVLNGKERDIKEVKVNIYAGNLSHELTEEELQEAFTEFGEITSARIITDRYSGVSRGFGFVEMPTKSEAEAAIAGMNGKELKGRALTVNEARPRTEGPRGGGGGGGQRW